MESLARSIERFVDGFANSSAAFDVPVRDSEPVARLKEDNYLDTVQMTPPIIQAKPKMCKTSYPQPRIFTEDLLVRDALLGHDDKVTRIFFYQQCYPLFKFIYDNYYTDCACVKEFIDDIYILALAPSKTTGKCQLENFRGESTLTSWLKTLCLYYCYNKYNLKERMPKYEPISTFKDDDNEESTDRTDAIYGSNDIDFDNLNRQDAMAILNMMPNKRYRSIISMRYLEQKTNEETAEALGMTMSNYYNKHKLAKEQYERVWRKEVQHG